MRRGILASREELTALRAYVGHQAFKDIYGVCRRRCALILESAPISERQWRYLWQQGHAASAIQAARAVQGRILDLLIAHHVEPNAAYRDRAIEELNGLVGWGTWVDPCHNDMPADLCTAEAAVAVAVGLDWLWEDLSDSDRDRMRRALMDKAIRPYLQGFRQQALWSNCYHHWNAVVNGGCGLAALALADEDEQAGQAYALARKALTRFFDALGREGGWDEGTGYWGYAMRYVLLLAEAACRLQDDQTLLHARGMDTTGLFPVYFMPNGRAASFGDTPAVPLCGTFYLLVRHFRRRETLWWLDTYAFHRDMSTTGWSAAGLALLFRPPRTRTPRKVNLKCAKAFRSVGWAALADHWPKPSFYVAAKTGDLSASHSQRDMNSLQLQVDGEMMLVDLGGVPGSEEYYSEARGDLYQAQARGHNTVAVGERDHEIDAQGRIVDCRAGEGFRYVLCDAGGACGENVTFLRHIVMVLDPTSHDGAMLLVLDDLTNGVPEKVETFWHTHGQIELDAGGVSGTIAGRRARLHFALHSTARVRVQTGSHALDRNHRDNVLWMTGGVIGRALTASVFARGKVGQVSFAEDDLGGLSVQAGPVAMLFKLTRRTLRLESVLVR